MTISYIALKKNVNTAKEKFNAIGKIVFIRGAAASRDDVLYFSSPRHDGKTGIFSASGPQISRRGGGIVRRVRTTSFLRACVEC